MSYDLHIYFSHETFPREEWDSVLALFNAESRSMEEAERFPDRAKWVVVAESRTTSKLKKNKNEREIDPLTGQTTWIGTSPVWIDLTPVLPIMWGDCIPVGSHWRVILETSGGASVKAVWTQFAIPYYALSFMEGITVHDCQWHRKGDLYSFQAAEEWAEFASVALPWRVRGWKKDLVTIGLISEEGKVLF